MANPKVLKAVSVALAALAELDPKEQEDAMRAIRSTLDAGKSPVSRGVDTSR